MAAMAVMDIGAIEATKTMDIMDGEECLYLHNFIN